MIHKPDFHAIAKKIMRHQRGVREHQIIHPVREWLIGIAAFVLLAATAAYWAFVMYVEINSRSVELSAAPVAEIVVYRPELVNAALARFGEREATYRELLENRITTVQPSILEVIEETTDEESDDSEEVVNEAVVPIEEVTAEAEDDVPVISFE